MNTFSLFPLLMWVGISLSLPSAPTYHESCLCSTSAHQTADNIQKFFSAYTNEFARRLLTKDMVDYTDSVQFLMNNGTNCPQPLGTATFPDRKTLIDAQGAQGSIPWENLDVYWDCENIFIRWASKQQPFVVRGIAIFRKLLIVLSKSAW